MPEITSCPDCDRQLRIRDELMGKKVKCPSCGTMFTARSQNAREEDDDEEEEERRPSRPSRSESVSDRRPVRRDSQEDDDRRSRRIRRDEEDEEDDRRERSRQRDDDDEDDRPRRRREYDEDEDDYDDDRRGRSGDTEAYRGVRLGIHLLMLGGWTFLGNLGVAIVGIVILIATGASLMAAFNPRMGGPPGAGLEALGTGIQVFFYFLGVISLIATGLQIVGCGMCMKVPPGRYGSARPLAITTFACMCVMLPYNLISYIPAFRNMVFTPNMAGLLMILNLLFAVVGIAGAIVWFFFLRQLCEQIRARETAGAVMRNLIAWVIYWPGSILLMFIVGCMGGIMGGMMANAGGRNPNNAASVGIGLMILVSIVGLALTITGLAFYIWYLFILLQVRTSLDRKLARR